MRLTEFYSREEVCSYISHKTSRFRYFHIKNVTSEFYKGLLERGWRRFGDCFCLPICNECTDCISIRTLIDNFILSRNHKRVIKKSSDLIIYKRKPTVTQEHIDLYNRYHEAMHAKKGWNHSPASIETYVELFVDGHQDFGYEILYYKGTQLIGVGLTDILDDSITAIYFYYDHEFANYSLGTLNILLQILEGKAVGLKYFYPGYWIKDHDCMGYKERFTPFEILENRPDIFDMPIWKMYEKGN